MMQPEAAAVSCENDEPNQLTIIFLANIAGSFQKYRHQRSIPKDSSMKIKIFIFDWKVEEDTAKLGAVKEFESQKRICIYIGELNAQSSSLHIDIAASSSPVRKNCLKNLTI